jgi:cytochrome c-type biogenesis protein CcmE
MATQLDRELEEAVAASAGASDGAPLAPSPRRERPRSNLVLLGFLLAVGAGLVGVFLYGFKSAAVYAVPVDQLLSAPATHVGRKVRVDGELVPGTLEKQDKPCEYRFTIFEGQAKLPVRYAQCVIPDTFRDMPEGGVKVTVEGTLTKEGRFEASLVMAKCTSKYDPKTHTMQDDATAAAQKPID